MMITISERINKSFLFIIPPPYGGKYSSFKCFVRYNNLYKNTIKRVNKKANFLDNKYIQENQTLYSFVKDKLE